MEPELSILPSFLLAGDVCGVQTSEFDDGGGILCLGNFVMRGHCECSSIGKCCPVRVGSRNNSLHMFFSKGALIKSAGEVGAPGLMMLSSRVAKMFEGAQLTPGHVN